jgi:hypothetical protein
MNETELNDHEISLRYAQFIYHGTSNGLLREISLKRGLIPPKRHKNSTNFVNSKKDCLYVTTSLSRAVYWARLVAERRGEEPIILRIRKEDVIGIITPDENLPFDETAFEIKDAKIPQFAVVEEEAFWNEMDVAYGEGKELPEPEKTRIWNCILNNKGVRL